MKMGIDAIRVISYAKIPYEADILVATLAVGNGEESP